MPFKPFLQQYLRARDLKNIYTRSLYRFQSSHHMFRCPKVYRCERALLLERMWYLYIASSISLPCAFFSSPGLSLKRVFIFYSVGGLHSCPLAPIGPRPILCLSQLQVFLRSIVQPMNGMQSGSNVSPFFPSMFVYSHFLKSFEGFVSLICTYQQIGKKLIMVISKLFQNAVRNAK